MAKAPPPTDSPPPHQSYGITSGTRNGGRRVGIYGPGGSGKTSLAAAILNIGRTPLFLDLDDGSGDLDVKRIGTDVLKDFSAVRETIQNENIWRNHDTLILDSVTKLEELAADHVLKHVPNDKGKLVENIEAYGFGKGYKHIFDAMIPVLGDLDQHVRAGRVVILVAHECTAKVPNPNGEDFIRYEPRLQNSERCSVRHRVKEWLDDLFFVGYDLSVSRDGKACGGGTRTIYASELPSHWAKSRRLADSIEYTKGSAQIWEELFNANAE